MKCIDLPKQACPQDLRLADGEVHLWMLKEGSIDQLSEEERGFADTINFPNARNQFIASRSGVRRIVATYLGCEFEDVEIVRSDAGKPSIRGGGALEFSVSHTGGYVFAAFACAPVGLDIERRERRSRNFMDIARRYYRPEEIKALENLPDEIEKRETFLRYWVCKEAITKLAGDGIARGLLRAEVMQDWSGRYDGRRVFMEEIGDGELLGAIACFQEIEVKGWFVL
jgi:phosphopantetheinyl transferase